MNMPGCIYIISNALVPVQKIFDEAIHNSVIVKNIRYSFFLNQILNLLPKEFRIECTCV